MSLHTAAQALWLALPVIAGGVIHVAGLRMGVFPRLARVPLDGGVTLRGRKLFGGNKTLRGVVLMTGATMLCAYGQALLAGQAAWARELALVQFAQLHPWAWGALLGLGYIAGELPNSLVKRQLDIAPGGRAPGRLAWLFWLVDQVDSMAGVLVFMAVVWVPSLEMVAWLFLITIVVHPLVALVMFGLGLKTRIG
jgi:hypothetical protein